MKAGRISEQGTHAQLMRQKGIYYSLVRRQAGDGTLGTAEGEPTKVLFSAETLPVSTLVER